MKAVILSVDSGIGVHDLTHGIPPQNVTVAALALQDALPWLPHACVVCCVVDPGVGTSRGSVILRLGEREFVAPDNGLLSAVASVAAPEVKAEFFRLKVGRALPSNTFHGRDLYAPAAVQLALENTSAVYGEPLEEVVSLRLPEPEFLGASAVLEVLAFDHFGNATLNLRRGDLRLAAFAEQSSHWRVVPLQPSGTAWEVNGLSETYGNVQPGESLLYWNSAGRLEIGVNHGSARAALGLALGERLRIDFNHSGF